MGRDRVAIIAGMRTPFVKAGGGLSQYSACELGVHAVSGLLKTHKIDPKSIEEHVFGIVIHDPRIPNVSREIVLASSLPKQVTAHSVSNHCISGMVAVPSIYDSIINGRIKTGIGGGTESMSNPPLLVNKQLSQILLSAYKESNYLSKLKPFLGLRPWHLPPDMISATEPSTGLTMGEHCEIMAKDWKVSQERQDEIAYRSHMNALKATRDGRLTSEIAPMNGIDQDLIIRADTSPQKLEKLSPAFDTSSRGSITAGNSSPLTDGASAVLLMSEEKALEEGREPLAYIKAFEYAAIDPKDGLLMAPALAVPRLLKKTGLTLSDMELIEMHEAFGAQVICNLIAWSQGWKEPSIGNIDNDKLNPLGSSIAVGHPFAATGGRIITTLANEMKRRNAKYGLISICAAGAMAGAMILERDVLTTAKEDVSPLRSAE